MHVSSQILLVKRQVNILNDRQADGLDSDILPLDFFDGRRLEFAAPSGDEICDREGIDSEGAIRKLVGDL